MVGKTTPPHSGKADASRLEASTLKSWESTELIQNPTVSWPAQSNDAFLALLRRAVSQYGKIHAASKLQHRYGYMIATVPWCRERYNWSCFNPAAQGARFSELVVPWSRSWNSNGWSTEALFLGMCRSSNSLPLARIVSFILEHHDTFPV